LPETKVWKTWRHFLAKVSASGCWFWTGILVLELCNEMCFPGRKCNKVFSKTPGLCYNYWQGNDCSLLRTFNLVNDHQKM
jgi:hypothetical protein